MYTFQLPISNLVIRSTETMLSSLDGLESFKRLWDAVEPGTSERPLPSFSDYSNSYLIPPFMPGTHFLAARIETMPHGQDVYHKGQRITHLDVIKRKIFQTLSPFLFSETCLLSAPKWLYRNLPAKCWWSLCNKATILSRVVLGYWYSHHAALLPTYTHTFSRMLAKQFSAEHQIIYLPS